MTRYFQYIYVVLVMGLLGCSPALNTGPRTTGDNIILEEEGEDEYDIIIDDPEFSGWLATNGYPQGWHSNDYYRQKNDRLVSEWNSRYHSRNGRTPYTFYINYDRTIDYGFDVNYQLYHYFRYLDQRYRLSLLGV